MGVSNKRKPISNPKEKKKVSVEYPQVPTKKWVPPDEMKKQPKPQGYQKPDGVTHKLKISSLKKIWHQFEFVGNAAVLLGNYSQHHKKYGIRTNGHQGACNCAVACVFASLYQMAQWDRFNMDRVLDIGDDLYIKSITRTGSTECDPSVPPQKVYNSFYLGRRKVSIAIDENLKTGSKILLLAQDKVKEVFQDVLSNFFKLSPTGIFTILGKSFAVWIQDNAYYLFDPTDHDDLGEPWKGFIGCGHSALFRTKTLDDVVSVLYKNAPVINMNTKFEVISCTIQRIIKIDTRPPDRLEDAIQTTVEVVVEETPPVSTPKDSDAAASESERRLQKCLVEDDDSNKMRMQEVSPTGESVDPEKRPAWSRASFHKSDSCHVKIPGKQYPKLVTYYIELEPSMVGILRAATCQTDVTFSKYRGRQSLGNALSALVMLRLHKSQGWVPMTVNTVLKHGDLLYRDAMLSIPRTQSLKLSNFQRKTEYEGKNFLPVIEDFVVIGRLQSADFDVLDLQPALEEFLVDNQCCVIIGPLTLAVWTEDMRFYMFDPNERDKNGRAIVKQTYVGENFVPLDYTPGVACVMWFADLKDLVQVYMENVEKSRRRDPFYLSKVRIEDYVEIPDSWYYFKGMLPGKWILRGTRSQSDRKYPQKSRNHQGPAISLAALALQGLKLMKEWTDETIDELLDVGDGLYTETVDSLNEKKLFVSNALTLAEVNKKFKMLDKEAVCEVQECVINGLIDPSNSDLPDLRKGVEDFFQDNELGIITSRNLSMAIWKKEEVFYYFDSYDRDEKGLKTGFGAACVVRTLVIEDLIASLEANLDPSEEDWFNISRVDVVYYDIGTDTSVVLPPLNNYTKINDGSAILRSLYSEKSATFGLNCGRQTLPMCLTAMAYNKLKPSIQWTRSDIDDVLSKGNAFYVETMNELNTQEKEKSNPPVEAPTGEQTADTGEKQQEKESQQVPVPVGETGEEDITSETEEDQIVVGTSNVRKEFSIGLNQFSFEFEDKGNGTIAENLKERLQELLSVDVQDEEDRREIILESKPLSVAIWRDENVFYVFDSKPRDKKGYAIGMEDWSGIEDASLEDMLEDMEEYGDYEDYEEEEEQAEGEEGEEEEEIQETTELDMEKAATGGAGDAGLVFPKEGEDFIEGQTGPFGLDEPEEWEEEYVRYLRPVHKSSSYWEEQEKNGRACVRWFAKLEDLVGYVCGNIPPKTAKDDEFSLMLVKMTNRIQLKDKFRQGKDKLSDVYSGDWYFFLEIEHGFWILRGTKTIYDELFPEKNRGKQSVPCCCISLVVAFIFGMVSYNDSSVDSILTYGDKLYTFVKRSRKKNIMTQGDKKLNEDEVNWLLEHEEFEIGDIPRRICISSFLADISIAPQTVIGDINSKSVTLAAGLNNFFSNAKFGLLQCKDLTVGIWRGEHTYFMFDGLSRGPSGLDAPMGAACITRFLSLDKMASVFKSNLPRLGRGTFYIHKLEMAKSLCPRVREPKTCTEAKPKTTVGGFKTVIPGKTIVRGNICQEDPKFGRGPNVFCVPIAVVALTMTLIHKASTWSRPILDDVINLGVQLYEDSVEALGYDFDPWQDKMTMDNVQKDYEVGVLKASCEFRNTEQSGVIDAKSEQVLNLRQGIERFFEENTHGILVTEPLTLAIWEEQSDTGGEPVIYMFDPNPRGPLGMPVFTGMACVVTFVNAKMASEHIIGCILESEQRNGEFVIVPVEVIVGNAKTRIKPKRSPTKSSIAVLPRCSKLVAAEEKKLLRKIAENERRRADAKKRELLGRKGYYTLRNGEAIVRGYKSQNWEGYSEESRNNQDIVNCVVALVMHHIFSIDNWNSKHVDLTLDTGDQLYIDSYIAYGPREKKLGLENVMRKFMMRNLEVHVTVYKPIISGSFDVPTLNRILNVFFQQEQFCMLSYEDQWVSVIFKSGLFYLFDPHERNMEGRTLRKDEKIGSAVVLRFDDLNNMALKLVDNLVVDENQEVEDFTLWLLNVDIRA